MKIVVDLNNPQDLAEALALLSGSASTAAAPAPAAPAPAAPPPPAAAPAAPPPPAPAPAAPAPAAPAAPAPTPAAPPAPPAAAGGITQVQVTQAVQAYTAVHKAAGAKARLEQMADALGLAKPLAIANIPPQHYATALQWFAV